MFDSKLSKCRYSPIATGRKTAVRHRQGLFLMPPTCLQRKMIFLKNDPTPTQMVISPEPLHRFPCGLKRSSRGILHFKMLQNEKNLRGEGKNHLLRRFLSAYTDSDTCRYKHDDRSTTQGPTLFSRPSSKPSNKVRYDSSSARRSHG